MPLTLRILNIKTMLVKDGWILKRIFALMLIITMIFSSIIVSGATIAGTSNTVTSISIGLPKSYAGQNATVTVLQTLMKLLLKR